MPVNIEHVNQVIAQRREARHVAVTDLPATVIAWFEEGEGIRQGWFVTRQLGIPALTEGVDLGEQDVVVFAKLEEVEVVLDQFQAPPGLGAEDREHILAELAWLGDRLSEAWSIAHSLVRTRGYHDTLGQVTPKLVLLTGELDDAIRYWKEIQREFERLGMALPDVR